MHKRLIFPISIFLLLNIITSRVQAQSVINTNKATSPPVNTPTKISDENTEILVDRLSQLDEQVNQLSQENKLTSTLEFLINILFLFSTIILGVFAVIGTFLIWNGFTLRQEAKENIEEIKWYKKLSAALYAEQKEKLTNYEKSADKSVRLLYKYVKQGKVIKEKEEKEAKDAISNYKRSKTVYAKAAIKIALDDSMRIRENLNLRQKAMRMSALGIKFKDNNKKTTNKNS